MIDSVGGWGEEPPTHPFLPHSNTHPNRVLERIRKKQNRSYDYLIIDNDGEYEAVPLQ